MNLSVESGTGLHGDIEPRSFLLGGRRFSVLEICDRWIARDHSYFKIRADDGATYILRHDELNLEWQLTLYRAPGL
ncbi:hypothetical protein [Noviherbaspirillum massiliense]|uniref:hypothetical protein n=1 Tax=Noviherbaspirillum massiliense TaxID=1465823 RepID=UPI0003198C6A|nr:hypothetical protein [Noviherbaspirillum massiliense]